MSGGMTAWADCMRPAGPAVVAHARRRGAAAAGRQGTVKGRAGVPVMASGNGQPVSWLGCYGNG
jgi:hypothetical protein